MENLAKIVTFLLGAVCMIAVGGIMTRIIDKYFPAFLRWLLCE